MLRISSMVTSAKAG